MKLLFVLSFALMTSCALGQESVGDCLNTLQDNLESDVDRVCQYFEDYVKCIIRALDLVHKEDAEEALEREQSAVNSMISQAGCEVDFHEIFEEVKREGDSYKAGSTHPKLSSDPGKMTVGDCLNLMQEKMESDPDHVCQIVEDTFKCYVRTQDIIDKEDAEEILASQQDALNSMFGQFGCSLDFQAIFQKMKKEEEYKDEMNGEGENMPGQSVFIGDYRNRDYPKYPVYSANGQTANQVPAKESKHCDDYPTCAGFATSPIGWLVALMTCFLCMLQL